MVSNIIEVEIDATKHTCKKARAALARWETATSYDSHSCVFCITHSPSPYTYHPISVPDPTCLSRVLDRRYGESDRLQQLMSAFYRVFWGMRTWRSDFEYQMDNDKSRPVMLVCGIGGSLQETDKERFGVRSRCSLEAFSFEAFRTSKV